MSIEYVQVAEEEGEESIELPAEEDGTLLLSTLQAQFPGACGLKYRNPENRAIRGVRCSLSNEARFYPPSTESGWGSEIFFCVFPKENKRKSDDNLENSTAKTKRIETRLRCTDLIVLGLPWKTTELNLREHFEEFGEVLMAQVKKDIRSGQSKGFGFIRFGSYEAQMRVLATRHLIDGRWCEVKVPNSKEGMIHQVPCKVFVGRCTEDITAEDLREYFSKFGEVTDVFIPKPFRAFSFVTFLDPEVAQSLCGEDHIVKGVSVHVSNAAPKSEQNRHSHYQNQTNGGIGGGGGGGGNMMGGGAGPMMPYRGGGGGGGGHGGHGGGHGGHGHGHGGMGPGGGNNLSQMGPGRPDNMQYSQRGSGGGGSGGSGGGGGAGGGGGGSGGYMGNHQMGHTNGWNNQNRGNLDMPNLQALGINPQGQNPTNQGQNLSNPLGVGLNLNQLPMNPAIVAAALNQWGLIGNLQNQNQDQGFGNSGPNSQSGGGGSSQGGGGGGFLSWMSQGGGGGGGGGGPINSGSSSSGNNMDGPPGGGGGNQPWSRHQTSSSGAPPGADSKANFL